MSSSCLKLLLALTLFVIITECRPKPRKACKDDSECGSGFSCIKTRIGKYMCAKAKAEAAKPSKYKTTNYKEGIERTHQFKVYDTNYLG